MFAGRGIALPGFVATLLVVLLALGLGLAAGWATDAITTAAKSPDASPVPTVNPSASETQQPSAPALKPITRKLTEEDGLAGAITTDVIATGDGTFAVIPGSDVPNDADGDVRWVSVAVERGIQANGSAFSAFVMKALSDDRGWAPLKSIQFARTDGAADYRILLASPATAEALCPEPHEVAPSGPVVGDPDGPTSSAEPSAAASAGADASGGRAEAQPTEAAEVSCSADGIIVVSIYDWIAGLDAFGADYDASRIYMLQHRLGHLLGEGEQTCTDGRASVMVDVATDFPDTCEANQWPDPDAVPAPASPDPSASATPPVP